MHNLKNINKSSVYIYDGSYYGFLCCVFQSVYSQTMPIEIATYEDNLITLYETIIIDTDEDKAKRVQRSIPSKISARAQKLIETVFLSCMKHKELKMLKFLLRGYREGGKILTKLGDPDVSPLLKAEKSLLSEAHLFNGFVRFADYGNFLAATITPKNFVLPFITKHFILRYKDDDIVIFDNTHRAALVYRSRCPEIISVDNIEFPPITEEEFKYRALWKRFYDTLSIQGRENPRCRMTHMPKRFWVNMLEMQDQ